MKKYYILILSAFILISNGCQNIKKADELYPIEITNLRLDKQKYVLSFKLVNNSDYSIFYRAFKKDLPLARLKGKIKNKDYYAEGLYDCGTGAKLVELKSWKSILCKCPLGDMFRPYIEDFMKIEIIDISLGIHKTKDRNSEKFYINKKTSIKIR